MFGAFLSLDNVMKLILVRICKIVYQIPGATIHDALGTSMLIGCEDAAEMDSLPKVSKNVSSFSMVPISLFLVEKCGFLTLSIKNIIPHNQLNSREIIHLKHILHEHFNSWLSVVEKLEFEIEFVGMHDAKFTYTTCCNALLGANFTGLSVLVYVYVVMVPSLRHSIWCFQTINTNCCIKKSSKNG